MRTYARRLLSAFLVLCMLSGLVPLAAIPATAAPAVAEYRRAAPEAAILNAHTGYDAGFYEKLKLNYGKEGCEYTAYYNGIGLFTGGKKSLIHRIKGVALECVTDCIVKGTDSLIK